MKHLWFNLIALFMLSVSQSHFVYRRIFLPPRSHLYPVFTYPWPVSVSVPVRVPVRTRAPAVIVKTPRPRWPTTTAASVANFPDVSVSASALRLPISGTVKDGGSRSRVGNGNITCVTRKRGHGHCLRMGDCYKIFNTTTIVRQCRQGQGVADRNAGNGRFWLINPRSLDLNSSVEATVADYEGIYFEPGFGPSPMQLSEALQDEIQATSQSIYCRGNGFTSKPICCPVDEIVEHYSSQSKSQNRQSLNVPDVSRGTLRLKKKPAVKFPQSCGVPKVIVRVKRVMRPGFSGTSKITGGTVATRGEFPWMVAIFGVSGKPTCGGSLINNNYVLTAAHCLATYNSNDVAKLKVTIGDHHLHSTVDGMHETRKISKIVLHNKFDLKHFADDIALMKLDRPVTFNDFIQPICLPPSEAQNVTHGDLEGKKVVVTGWGRERSHGSLSPVLRKVEIPIWKHSECQRIYKIFAPDMKVLDTHVCAVDNRRSKDACVGDSGGPLVFSSGSKWYQLGIVSWGKGCGAFPGVYTRVDKYLPWIEKNID